MAEFNAECANRTALLEVIATTVDDALTAERAGADRIELIAGMPEGGLTPSLGLIEAVCGSVRIPVRVMIRPHSQSFVYSRSDLDVMLADVRHIRSIKPDGLVFGALRPDDTIDEEALKRLLAEADGLPVTFHRAFDESRSLEEALDRLSAYLQVTDILTSGGEATAVQGGERLRGLVGRAAVLGNRPQIMAGAGLSASGLEALLRQTGVRRVHIGSAARKDGFPLLPVELDRVLAVRAVLDKWERGSAE